MHTEYYGLHEHPFQMTPNARLYFASSAHRRAHAHLTFGLAQHEGFIVVTGEVGAGKTTLIERLCEELDPHDFVIARIATTLVSGDDVLRMVADAFGAEPEGNKASVLRGIAAALRHSQRRHLLIVDEAQGLVPAALEELRMLSNLTHPGQPPLQTLLMGQPQLRRLLVSPALSQLRQRVLASYHLSGLTREETHAYVMHRLRAVGWAGRPSWEPGALDLVHAHSDGLPRRINRLCARVMLSGALEGRDHLTAEMVAMVAQELEQDLGGGAMVHVPAHRRPAPMPEPSATHGRPPQTAGHQAGDHEEGGHQDGRHRDGVRQALGHDNTAHMAAAMAPRPDDATPTPPAEPSSAAESRSAPSACVSPGSVREDGHPGDGTATPGATIMSPETGVVAFAEAPNAASAREEGVEQDSPSMVEAALGPASGPFNAPPTWPGEEARLPEASLAAAAGFETPGQQERPVEVTPGRAQAPAAEECVVEAPPTEQPTGEAPSVQETGVDAARAEVLPAAQAAVAESGLQPPAVAPQPGEASPARTEVRLPPGLVPMSFAALGGAPRTLRPEALIPPPLPGACRHHAAPRVMLTAEAEVMFDTLTRPPPPPPIVPSRRREEEPERLFNWVFKLLPNNRSRR